ncbi:MAG: sterol desaturase family protein [Bacteroidetes bacterium]|nr:sterol desaturase family protein [Bacteroidota bacterium]
MDYNILRLYAILALILYVIIIVILERMYPYKEQKLFRKWFWNDFIFYTIFQGIVMGFIIAELIMFIDNHAQLSRLQLVSDWPLGTQLLFFLVTHDLFIFAFHWLMHHNRFLWRFHEAHHSVRDVDWVAGSRSHPFEILINQTVEFAPIVILGAAPEIALLKGLIDGAWGVWIHANINVYTGWIQYVINGPEMHRWHHASGYGRINLATKLAIWDWIFGTAYRPKDKKIEQYGLCYSGYPGGYFRQFVSFFRKDVPIDRPPRKTDVAN